MISILEQLDVLMAGEFALLRESVEIECKLASGIDGKGGVPKSFWETYSAFANTNGGIIILGVKELKNATLQAYGIENIFQTKADLFNSLNNPLKVNINLLTDDMVREWVIDGKTTLAIGVPRASRKQQPIYLHNNPLNNTYIRRHEGDYKLDDEQVKRLLAEQSEEGRDSEILANFGINDLAFESLRSYRQRYSNLNPYAELNDLSDLEFLRRIGAYGVNRETGVEGLTKGGLLMFGMHHTIAEVFPNYLIDYQEYSSDRLNERWSDRVIPDGSWSGNLYDFYRKVYVKLVETLKVPFRIKDGVRQDDTVVHIALREALVNCIVHADYTDRASLLVVKYPDRFRFRNPGLMRVPIEYALKGSESDCRNRKLHQMFRLINVGEQAGSGVPKILSGWESQHWVPPYLHEKREPNNQTVLELTMVDLFPAETMQLLTDQFGSRFTELSQNERAALAIAKLEGMVTHSRLQTVVASHSVDISRDLQHLVKNEFLNSSGGRGAVYTLVGVEVLTPDDIFNGIESGGKDFSEEINIPLKEAVVSRNNLNRDEFGRLCSDKLEWPVIDDVSSLSEEFKLKLFDIAEETRTKQRVSPAVMENIILSLCQEQFITLGALAEVLNRKPEVIRRKYLTLMVKGQILTLAFPTTPTHVKQAYRAL